MAENVPNLRTFVLDFFDFFQASVTRLDKKKQGPLAVTLPPELVEHFGTPELKLAFQNVEGGDFELVAHGSRVFDRILSYLERRGALTLQHLPVRYSGSEELLAAVQPVNAGIANLQMQEQMEPLFIFNWRITYRADDKREELFTVALDEAGERVPLNAEQPIEGGQTPVDLDALLEAGEPPPPERNEEGQLIPPRLVPMTQLVRLAETARKYATYHADLRCVSHEADILPRLYQTLNRLTTYYEQQIQEVYDTHDPTGEKRAALEHDLSRKIAEEVENHRLRVQVTLFSYALVQMPVAVAQIELSDGKRTAEIQVKRNRYSGDVDLPPCHVCSAPLAQLTLDRAGHVVCNACVDVCESCRDLVCHECGVAPCPVCEKQNCDQCAQECWACGEYACSEHIDRCPICMDSICHVCQTACAECGTRQCRSHLRADAVVAGSGDDALICGECAVRCPGCEQYSAQVGICKASGQRFCENCLITCTECGDRFGTGFYRRNPSNGDPYCENCLKECPACHELTPTILACPVCGETCCHGCGQVCAVCARPHCEQHSFRFGDHMHPDCTHVVCLEHRAVCRACEQSGGTTAVCPICGPEVCPICEATHCVEHMRACLRCGMDYCTTCLAEDQTCETCAQVKHKGRVVHIEDEPCYKDARVGNLAGIYNWLCLENARYRIYRGTATLLPEVTIAADKRTRKVLAVRKVSLMDSLRSRFGR